MPPNSDGNAPYIASREIFAVGPKGEEFAVRICIGKPYQCGEDEWACAVAVEGLYPNLRDQHGVDSFQALMLAQKLAMTLLIGFIEDGGRLLNGPGGVPVDIGLIFASGVLS